MAPDSASFHPSSALVAAPMRGPVRIEFGVAPQHRADAARLYWLAFGDKLGRVMGPRRRALAYLDRVIHPDHGLSAVAADGRLCGVAGFRTAAGGFTAGKFSDLAAVFGYFGASWRAVLLRLMVSDFDNQRFLVDGIAVAEDCRGQGVGGALIQALCDEAARRGYGEIRLDVADVNPRAQALYERAGFVAGRVDRMGLLAPIFRFSHSTRMVRKLG